jgi:hypothetical protein
MSTIDNLLKDIPIPRVMKIRQIFDGSKLDDPVAEMKIQILKNQSYNNIKSGMKIAVAVGSRGINHIPEFVKEIIRLLKARGAEPFIVPCMGSHAGATAEGQKGMLEGLGVTEEYTEAPIRATMEVVQLGTTAGNKLPVVIDKYADEADGIIIINRIKPHVAFRGPYESGLMKMISIGLGKQKGADYCHNLGFGKMAEHVPEIAKEVIRQKNIVFAVGIVENAYHETKIVAVLNKDEIEKREATLQEIAKKLSSRLWFEKLDVCIIDELGKNISGTGFDTMVVGRFHTPFIKGGPTITKFAILDLTDVSHGNANGIGIADFTSKRLYDKFDPEQTYPNALTSTVPASVKMPMVLKNDKQVIQASIKTCNLVDKTQVRFARFKNTLELDVLEVSENMKEEVEQHPNMEIISAPYELQFNNDDNLW